VLTNGEEAGVQKLELGRLQANGTYKIEQTGEQFQADSKGNASIDVALDGRTEVHIVPCSGK
jgi:alpha-galactosidase